MHERLETTSRRTFLKATATTGALLGIGGTASAQETTSYQLGGRVSGWQGQSPSSIEGETNPTLELQEGTQYEITWENLDGVPHNIAILDGDGNALQSTDNVSEQGATQTITFTASSEMAQYICQVHPNTMVGGLNITSGGGGTTTTDGGGETTTGEGGETTTAGEGGETTTAGGGGGEATTTAAEETTTAAEETTTAAEEETTTAAGEETPTNGQPGFGIVAALGALGSAAAYLFQRSDEE